MIRYPSARRAVAVVPLALALLLAGCAAGATRHAASVVDYLYPEQGPTARPAMAGDSAVVPVLRLPLRVGVAFVPSRHEHGHDARMRLSETDRAALLEDVASHFRKQRFVQAIEIVPSSYLMPRGGFANLEQVGRMFDLDVVALVSYDQVQFTDERRSALTYLTIVGAYVVDGEKNDTRTMFDAAVIDLRSRRLLFRAPGVSHVKGSAALVNLSDRLREDSESGFRLAAKDLTTNLDRELDRFKDKVKASPSEYRVVSAPSGAGGRTGAGSLDAWALALLVALGGSALWPRRPRR